MNNITLIGRLTREPELKYIPTTGTAVATISLAVGRNFKGQDGKEEADFIICRCWGKVAENVSTYLGKGSLVGVEGSLRVDKYVQDDLTKTFTYVNCQRVQFLESKNKNKNNNQDEMPSFEAINDDDLPFD